MMVLEGVRDWVLGRADPREGALFVFSWAVGVATAAGYRVSELAEILGKPEAMKLPAERNVVEVIDRVLAVVPEDESDFRERLTAIRVEALASDPNRQGGIWLAIGDVFFTRFGMAPPIGGWGRQASSIVLGELG